MYLLALCISTSRVGSIQSIGMSKCVFSKKLDQNEKKNIIRHSVVVFNSHSFAFSPTGTLIGGGSSTDQLDRFGGTVFRNSKNCPNDNTNPGG